MTLYEECVLWHRLTLGPNEILMFVMFCLFSFHISLINIGKVFVTYETDNDEHVKEVIKFVALLRHNGFFTHVRQ